MVRSVLALGVLLAVGAAASAQGRVVQRKAREAGPPVLPKPARVFEGAGQADVGLKQAIEQGIIPGPRMLVTTRAIVATGSYAPRGYALSLPQGAEEADGDTLIRVVRDQIGHGADWIKVYADYPWGPT